MPSACAGRFPRCGKDDLVGRRTFRLKRQNDQEQVSKDVDLEDQSSLTLPWSKSVAAKHTLSKLFFKLITEDDPFDWSEGADEFSD